MSTENFTGLFDEAAKLFANLHSNVANEVIAALIKVPLSNTEGSPKIASDEVARLPEAPLQQLFDPKSVAGTGKCFERIIRIQDMLRWFGSSRANGAMYAQLVGPGSIFHNDKIRFGLFLLPKNFNYPSHVHGADEIYIVVAGSISLSVGGEEFFKRQSGDYIEVPSMTEHALFTESRSALILWAWTGDITLDRYRFINC